MLLAVSPIFASTHRKKGGTKTVSGGQNTPESLHEALATKNTICRPNISPPKVRPESHQVLCLKGFGGSPGALFEVVWRAMVERRIAHISGVFYFREDPPNKKNTLLRAVPSSLEKNSKTKATDASGSVSYFCEYTQKKGWNKNCFGRSKHSRKPP